nr:hypothetical protein [uncultured Mucilaginibacter sp.]
MLLHLVKFKGKGFWVILLPMLSAFVLFQLAEFLPINRDFVGAIALTISGTLLFFYDNQRPTIVEGDIIKKKIKLPREKNRNSMMWIEVRYWGLLMVVVGLIWMGNLQQFV